MKLSPPFPLPPQQTQLTFESFLAQYGQDDRYELIDAEVFDLEPTGLHEQVAAYIARKLNVQIDQAALPHFVLQRGILKPLGEFTGFRPDVLVVDERRLAQEPLWESQSVLTLGASVLFVAEVVSGNWQNDYARKFEDYALLGIGEYWIVDHEGLGGEVFIGRPKQPTLTQCVLGDDGRYQTQLLRGDQPVVSPTFPGLHLTAHQVLTAGLERPI